MKRSEIHLIAGARPNFMKIAPLYHALARENWCTARIVHTGQHYDTDMSDSFFRDLGLPEADHHLGIGSGTHARQTASVMVAYEDLCLRQRPAWCVVVGDVNSTVACTLAAAKLQVPVAHVEAGLRSRDRSMPEEINRLVTDAVADLLWTPSEDADENLLNEGIPQARIVRVGNIMIDSYELLRRRVELTRTRQKFGLGAGAYGAVTLHRPSNVDRMEDLSPLVDELCAVSETVPLVFAVHPRTKQRLETFDLKQRLQSAPGIYLTSPMNYISFMGLVREAMFVITDSGGIQEETTYLNIPCLTLRDTTERPITITQGTNRLVARDNLPAAVDEVINGEWPSGSCPDLWDGHSADRIVASLRKRLVDSATGAQSET